MLSMSNALRYYVEAIVKKEERETKEKWLKKCEKEWVK